MADGASIQVDTREPKYIGALLRGLGITVDSRTLTAGDYAWPCPLGLVGVERKTVTDLVNCIKSGVAMWQLDKLCKEYIVPILMIEGPLNVDTVGDLVHYIGGKTHRLMAAGGVRDWLLARQLEGVFVDTCDERRVHYRLKELHAWSQKLTEIHRPVLVKREALDPRVAVLASLPGVGVVKAAALLAKYSTLRLALRALVDNKLEADVLEDKLLKRLQNFLSGKD